MANTFDCIWTVETRTGLHKAPARDLLRDFGPDVLSHDLAEHSPWCHCKRVGDDPTDPFGDGPPPF